MSFDDGDNGTAFNYELKARVRAAIDAEGFLWNEFVAAVGHSSERIVEAVNAGVTHSYDHVEVLSKIAVVLGRDLSWLLTGSNDAECQFKETLRERVARLVWEYIYKAELPRSHWRVLLKRIDALVLALNCTTERAAYRLGVPQTWKDVGQHYRDLERTGRLPACRQGGD